MLSILTCQLSSVGSKTWVREVETYLAQPWGSDRGFGCPRARWTSWWLLSRTIQLCTDKKFVFIAPLLLSQQGIISSSHTKSAAWGCSCALTALLYRKTPQNSPNCDWDFRMSQSCSTTGVSITFSPFLPSWCFSGSQQFTWVSLITGLGLCWLVAWSGAS